MQKLFFGTPQNWQNCCCLWVRQHSESKITPNSPFEVPHAIFLVSSIDSLERNGVQKAFLGKLQKGRNCCFLWVCENPTSTFVNLILVSSTDSIQRNGSQKTLLGKPQKEQNFNFCGFVKIQRPLSRIEVPCTIYLSVVNRFC